MEQQNPMQLIQGIRSGKINPQQLAMNLLQQNMGNTPLGQNLIGLAQAGKTSDIEQTVRNLAKQRGIDYDKEFASFRQMLGF